MLAFLQGVAGFVFIFGVVVFVHELGHFLAAKLTGVYAPKFSIGFGPGPSKKWGETQYILGLIPLGGYVRMASRDDEATAFLEGGSEEAAARAQESGEVPRPKDWDPNGLIPFGPNPVPAHRWFESKPLYQRLIILLAGVTMNALLALVVLIGMAACYGRNIAETRVVGSVRQIEGTEPLRAAILLRDTITAVQGQDVRNWNEIDRAIRTARGDTLHITTQRGVVSVPAGSPSGPQRMRYAYALEPFSPPVIGTVSPGKPAALGGVQAGDSITGVGGEPVAVFSDLVDRVSASAGTPIELELVRDSTIVRVTVVPEATVIENPLTGRDTTVGRIGASAANRTVFRHDELSFREAVVEGATQTREFAGTIFAILGGLFQREIGVDQLGGPIEIAKQSANAAQQGMDALLQLLALLSINLAVLNLLPIPVLDGGQILLQVAESVKGSPFSARTRQYILGTGVALVLLLMLVVSYNDILRLFS
jgi:regulator of sigma E protease